MSARLLRNAAAIMTGLPGAAARAAGPDVRIRHGTVAEIGQLAPDAGERTLDVGGCVVYPGWVNTHHHLAQSMLKGVPAGINAPLLEWLAAVPYRYRGFFDAELLELAATIGSAELMLSGCTTVADHHYVYYPGMPYDGAKVLFDTAARRGVRFVLCRGGNTISRDFEGGAGPAHLRPETFDEIVGDVERLVATHHEPAPDAMGRVVMAPTTPAWSARPEELKGFVRAARRLGIRLHSHLSETADYVRFCRDVHGTTPLEFAARHEWVGPDVWFAHMVHLPAPEIRLAAATGTGIAHCPASNCRLDRVGGLAPGYVADIAVYDLREPRYAGLHDPAIGPVASGGRPHLKYLLVNGKIGVEYDVIPGLDRAEVARRARAAIERMVH